MRSPRRRGFTLIEVVIVVAIIGIVLAISIAGIQRSREMVSVDRATSQVRSAIEEARELAAVAGSRAGTARITPGPGCTWTFGNQMEVTINPAAGTVNYPSDVRFSGVGSDLIVNCETWTLSNVLAPGSAAAFTAPAGTLNFAFSPTGHLIPNVPVFVQISSPNDAQNPGVRILTSGVMCQASDPTGGCDEETRW